MTRYGWLSMAEFTDLITISQMTPGPIAVNSATFVGIRIAGIPGALVATFGCILPSCILVTAIARLYLKYRNMSVLQGVLGSLQPGGGRHDRLGGHLHSPDRLLGRRRCDLLGHQLADGRPFCSGLPAAPDPSHRPHPGDAPGGPGPGGSVAPCWEFRKNLPSVRPDRGFFISRGYNAGQNCDRIAVENIPYSAAFRAADEERKCKAMKIIEREEILRRLTPAWCIGLMRDCLSQLEEGRAVQYLRTVTPLPSGDIMGYMPAAVSGAFGAKVITVFHHNGEKGRPPHQGSVRFLTAKPVPSRPCWTAAPSPRSAPVQPVPLPPICWPVPMPKCWR